VIELDPTSEDSGVAGVKSPPLLRRRRRRRTAPADSHDWRLSVADGLLGLTVIVSPQFLGGATLWSVAAIALLSAATLVVTVWAQVRELPPPPWGNWAFLALSLGLTWTVVQAVPLPAELTGWLSPTSREVADRIAAALGRGEPRFVPISRDPGATAAAIVQGIGLMSVLEAARWRGAGGGGTRLLAAAAASAIVMAAVALVHELAGATELFGVYDPVFARPTVISPMLNANHLSGFCGFGVPIVWGLAIQSNSTPARLTLWGAGVLCLGIAFATLSRGGISSAIAGIVCFAGMLLLRRRPTGLSSRAAQTTAVAAAVSVAVLTWLLAEPLSRELDGSSNDKLALLSHGWLFASEAPLVGVGRGGFSSAFVGTHGSMRRFEHAENLVVQWTSEWGLPMTSVVLLAMVLAFTRALRTISSPAALGAAAALVGIVLHDMVDFALELPATATVAAATLGALSGIGTAGFDTARRRSCSRWAAGGLGAVSLIAVIALGPGLPAKDVRYLNERLAGLSDRGAFLKFDETLAEALSLHPSEPSFALLAGRRARLSRSDGTGRWLNLAMDLAPGWSSPHLEASVWLFESGRIDQATVELRAAASRDPKGAVASICPRLKKRDDPVELERITPFNDGSRTPFLVAVSRCVALDSEVGQRADDLLLEEHGGFPEARARVARRLANQGRASDAIQLLRETLRLHPRTSAAWLALARVQLDAGDAAAAVETCGRGATHVDDPWELLTLRAKAHAGLQHDAAMREDIAQLERLSGDSIDRRAEAAVLLGRLEERRGHLARALRAYGRAYRYGSDPRVLEDVARVAERLGDLGRAFAAWAELCSLRPNDGTACTERRRLFPGR